MNVLNVLLLRDCDLTCFQFFFLKLPLDTVNGAE